MQGFSNTILNYVVWAVVFFGCNALAQDPTADIRQAEDQWVSAIKSHDKSALESILSPDLIYTHSTARVEDRDQYIESLTSGAQNYAGVDYEKPLIRVYGTTAVVAAKVTMTGSTKGQIQLQIA